MSYTYDEDDDRYLRMYNPQQYYYQNPYIPPAADEEETDSSLGLATEGGGGDNPNNPNANPFGDEEGNISYNPNLIGAYIPGYEQDLNYDISPIANYTVGTTEDDDDEGGFNLGSYTPGGFLINNFVSPIRDFVNNYFGYEDDGLTPTDDGPTDDSPTDDSPSSIVSAGINAGTGGGYSHDPAADKRAKDMQKDIDQGYGGQNVHG